MVDHYILPNGTSTHYTYDNAGRLTQVWNKYGSDTITRHTYSLNAAGIITQTEEVMIEFVGWSEDEDNTGLLTYTYDAMYRLIGEHRDLPTPQSEREYEYAYDPVGNRLSMTYYPNPSFPFIHDDTEYDYDAAGRILESTGDYEEEYTVDANGNMTRRGKNNDLLYVYDQANRLIEAEAGNDNYLFAYDGDGKRVGKWEEGFLSPTLLDVYVYDVSKTLPLLIQDLSNRYVYGLGLLYMEDSQGDPYFYHPDGLGFMRMITNDDTPTPEIEMYEVYDAFGNEGYSNTLHDQPFKFTGEPKDENETELIYLRARYYDPVIGRFITRDTVAGQTTSPLTLNRYSYVENNPVNSTDPSGHASNKVLSCGVTSGAYVPACEARIGYGIIEAELKYHQGLFDNLNSAEKAALALLYDAPIVGIYDTSRVVSLEAGGVQLLEYDGHVWDTSSLGNVIWGYHMKKLGFSLERTLSFANEISKFQYGTSDPPDDQSQIRAGYMYGD